MNIIFNFSRALIIQVFVLAAISSVAFAQETTPAQTTPPPQTDPAQTTPPPQTDPAQTTPVEPEQKITSRVCSLDPVESLLPPPQTETTSGNSLLSYLAEQGFTQEKDGSWACYANDPKKEGRYFTVFKVQETNGRIIGSSFLDEGTLIEGQDNRSLDFFMLLIERHMSKSQQNSQGIRRYLEAFISLVKQGKIKPTRRGFLFDQPSRALVLYHTLSTGTLKGTAITVNINLSKT
ncbi:MAG: hypothetical protein KME21_20700 [Desmonostoc vinosum HA7617-LM4]|nr:hypothetical protein [Desmonostoc vinosum HA7617-LM4]